MMKDDEILSAIRSRIAADPSGKSVADLVIEQKSLGLPKKDAERLLTVVMIECRNSTLGGESAEQREEAIAGVLDRVTGWCSHNHIYPRDS
jgi:hypothetical protein